MSIKLLYKLVLFAMISCYFDYTIAQESLTKYMDTWKEAGIEEKISKIEQFRDFAQQQTSTETIHSTLVLQYAECLDDLYSAIKESWEVAAQQFTEALICYEDGNRTEGVKFLQQGINRGSFSLSMTATYKRLYKAKIENSVQDELDILSQIVTDLEGIPGSPIQYPRPRS